ncbi:MAG TPA: hypothetical protein VIG93_03170, partial [Gaiellaceae bacterium]
MTGALLVAGPAVVAVGGGLATLRWTFRAGVVAQAVGCAVLAVGGFWALFADAELGAQFTSGFEPQVGVDALSGFFLGVLGAIGAAALLFAFRYLAPGGRGRAIACLTAGFVLAQALVLVARDPLTFLVAWEVMTLVPAAVILVSRADAAARQTVFTYVALTHLAGAGTWIAILLL